MIRKARKMPKPVDHELAGTRDQAKESPWHRGEERPGDTQEKWPLQSPPRRLEGVNRELRGFEILKEALGLE